VLAQLQSYPFVARFMGLYALPRAAATQCGSDRALAMSFHGETITALRTRQPAHRLRVSTACDLALQMLQALESLHCEGLLHRDVKPSNFVLAFPHQYHADSLREEWTRAGEREQWARRALPTVEGGHPGWSQVVALDFGLCRQHLQEADWQPRRARSVADFRGTSQYASLTAHENQELGRRDDLWSLLYLLADLCVPGGLPWRVRRSERELCHKGKQLYAGEEIRLFPPDLPGRQHLGEAIDCVRTRISPPSVSSEPAGRSSEDWRMRCATWSRLRPYLSKVSSGTSMAIS
jgi:tau tubulin kinase